jgi:hydroxymethylpyrimidine pyrophosphatase-like HAD family hydrolase
VIDQLPILMFSLIGLPLEALAPVADKLGGTAEVHLDRAYDLPGLFALTVTPHGLSKWRGVQAWCDHAGVTATRIIALGDGPNDVELLANATVALVPETAHPAAHAHAHHVIPPAADGGWAHLLHYL